MATGFIRNANYANDEGSHKRCTEYMIVASKMDERAARGGVLETGIKVALLNEFGSVARRQTNTDGQGSTNLPFQDNFVSSEEQTKETDAKQDLVCNVQAQVFTGCLVANKNGSDDKGYCANCRNIEIYI